MSENGKSFQASAAGSDIYTFDCAEGSRSEAMGTMSIDCQRKGSYTHSDSAHLRLQRGVSRGCG